MKDKIVPYVTALLIFVVVAIAYFSPVLEGKQLFQNDIANFKGVSKEISDYRAKHHQEPYWTNRAFGGMPSYQLSTYYPHNYIKKLDSVLRFLPRPADYLFLYFVGFFALLMVLKVDWKLAILGALGFGFSTYLISILGVGHNAKAHAIAYMPLVLAGIITVFRGHYFGGFILTAVAMALEITASHPQMTYYLLFMVLILGIVFMIDAFKQKTLAQFFKSVGVLFAALVIAIGVNATSLLATKEYAAHSTRAKSELTITPEGTPKKEIPSGLSREYITQYSYGKVETFNLLIPRFTGGGNREDLGVKADLFEFLNAQPEIGRKQAESYAENFPGYWGDQIIVEAPFYIGAVFIFLFVFGLFFVKGRMKVWLLSATIFSILLSWGKNFPALTNFFIDYVPLYNKFRAVTSIQVIAQMAIPLLGILALNQFLKTKSFKKDDLKKLKWAAFGVGGVVLFFVLFGTSLFSFESFRDQQLQGINQHFPGFIDTIIKDRKRIFFNDSVRSLLLILFAAGLLWGFMKAKLSRKTVFIGFVVLILFDLVGVDRRYVNTENFVAKRKVEQPYVASEINKTILQDTTYYRVMNFNVDPFNDGSTSYFHNSIGGYHAAKPRRYQELYEHYIAKNNMEILAMLNTKYFIFTDNQVDPPVERVQLNPDANGNAWFVTSVHFVDTADEEIQALDGLRTKTDVVVNNEFKPIVKKDQFEIDSTATIKLTHYEPNELIYESFASSEQLVVFSDMYYKEGWNAYVDGELTPHIRANYVLRAMVLPAGKHQVVFKFEPRVIKTGSTITLISYALLFLIPLGWFFLDKRNQEPKE
ncbi:YfhO family protein [Flavobacteriaceae bacterium F08102]|nr:YfhO family protein [Flavobacteriaceae bacterium F08102]